PGQGRRVRVERVALALRAHIPDRARHGVAQVLLADQVVLPGGRVRVLEVGHEHVRAGIERVDYHLPVHGTGDLDAPLEQVGTDRRDGPVALADVARL